MLDQLSVIQTIAVVALPLLFAIVVHEVSHGWAALALGDRTAEMLGRLSLNPVRHIDPFGTVILPLGLVITASLAGTPPFVFGWAKPVPVTWENLARPRRDMALVAVAGPLSNLVMALLWGLVAKGGYGLGSGMGDFLVLVGLIGVVVNLVIGLLNLVPIPPLDGSRLVSAILPESAAATYNRAESWGVVALLLLLVFGLLDPVLGPLVSGLRQGIHQFIGL
ncbi:site-2 protease family protein [Thiohalospira sp.]|uniref:site-2 protease family protein n=1 Tax=Thiohalospira sp. TaxID=3080549 RepID=UPI0039813F3D